MDEASKETLPAINEAKSVMDLIIKAGDTMDPARIAALMDLHDRALAREAKRQYDEAFVLMKPHLPIVVKTKKNKQTDSNYAPLEDVNKVVDPILAEYGFGTSTKVIAQTPDLITVEAELRHRGGHTERTSLSMPPDNKGMQGAINKTMQHGISSTVTYLKRVTVCAILNISTGDDKDGNLDSSVITNEQALEIDLLITEVKGDKVNFLKRMRADSVQNILARDYVKAKDLLSAKKKANEKIA